MGLLLGLLWVDRRLRRGGSPVLGFNFAASTGAGLVLLPSLWLLVLLMVGVGCRFDLAGGGRFDLDFASAWPGGGGDIGLWSWSLGVVAWRWWCGLAVNNQQLSVVWSWQ
jgi:hypothetical protein